MSESPITPSSVTPPASDLAPEVPVVPVAASPKAIDEQLQKELDEALGGKSVEQLMDEAAAESAKQAAEAGATKESDSEEGGGQVAMQMVRGRISEIRGDDVFVEMMGMTGKNQGVVPLTQFERPPRVGSVMDFVVQNVNEAEGLTTLSREGAVTRSSWEQLQRGAVVEARAVKSNKGGLELEMAGGIRAFMPASQIDLKHVDDLEQFVGQKLQAMVQEIDRKSKKVLLSRRVYLDVQRKQAQEQIWQKLEVGQVMQGKVSSLAEYGAFVDIGGVDGLVHVTDMSYSRVDKPGDVLTVGQEVQVKVLKLDAERKRISLGLKQVAPDPWDGLEGRLKTGQQVSAKVVRVADFGAFVEIFSGVEGLLPVSEMSWKRIGKPSDVVKVGDSLRLSVLQVDITKRRISLSLKQANGDPWMGASHKYAKHALADATVISITDFGAFFELEPGVEGLVHISELADRRVNAVGDVVKLGEKHQVRVLEVDEDARRIRLSIKAVKQAPTEPAEPKAESQKLASKAEGKPAGSGKPVAPPTAARKAKASNPNLKGGMEGRSLGVGLGDLKL